MSHNAGSPTASNLDADTGLPGPRRTGVAWEAMALAVYGSCFLAILTLVFSGFTRDDLEVAYYAQGWRFHTHPDHLPLYDWLAQALVSVLGPTPLATGLLKVALMMTAYAFVWLGIRRITDSRGLATIAAAGIPACHFFGYMAIRNYTHSALLLAALAGLFCAAAYLITASARSHGRPWAALGLGIAISIGLMSKFSFVLFAACLLAVLPWQSMTRGHTVKLVPMVLAGALPGAAIVGIWLVTLPQPLLPHLATALESEREMGLLARAVAIAGDAVLTPILRLLPGLLLPLLLAPITLWRGHAGPRPATEGRAEPCRLWANRLALYAVCCAVVVIAATLLGGGTRVREHYMAPVIVFAPAYLALRFGAGGITAARARMIGLGLMGIAGIYLVTVTIAAIWVSPASCGRCLMNLPVQAVGQQIADAGFRGGTIVSDWLDWSANLRLVFPESRLVAEEFPLVHRAGGESGGCLILTGTLDVPAHPERVAALLAERFGTILPADAELRTASAPLAFSDNRAVEVAYFLFPDGLGDCR